MVCGIAEYLYSFLMYFDSPKSLSTYGTARKSTKQKPHAKTSYKIYLASQISRFTFLLFTGSRTLGKESYTRLFTLTMCIFVCYRIRALLLKRCCETEVSTRGYCIPVFCGFLAALDSICSPFWSP